MRFFAYIFLITLIISTSCVSDKTEVAEREDVEFEGNVVEEREREEIRLGEGTIYEALNMDNEGLKTMDGALRATGLDTVLSQGGPYTLFAPSDAAFDRLRENDAGYKGIPDSLGNEEMRNILLHHVVKGRYSDAEIAQMDELETMYGGSLKVIKSESKLTVDSAYIVYGNREAENGYIHIIDNVLFPSSPQERTDIRDQNAESENQPQHPG